MFDNPGAHLTIYNVINIQRHEVLKIFSLYISHSLVQYLLIKNVSPSIEIYFAKNSFSSIFLFVSVFFFLLLNYAFTRSATVKCLSLSKIFLTEHFLVRFLPIISFVRDRPRLKQSLYHSNTACAIYIHACMTCFLDISCFL